MHIRIIDGAETIVSRAITAQSSTGANTSADISPLAKRWDGSPAYAEWAPAYNRGCTLNGMLNLDDAPAGQLFVPPRPSANSDFLEVDGRSQIANS